MHVAVFSRITPPQPSGPLAAPFRVLHLQQDRNESGSFRPDARLMLSPALCTTGFWAGLDPQDAHTLILLLSFLSPNGHAAPALSQVADALRCSPIQARSSLLRLTRAQWQGKSLAVLLPRQDGNDAYAPSPHLLTEEHFSQSQDRSQEPRPPAAGRERVIAHSRSRYARPRAEVEAGINDRMGWGPPAFDTDTPDLAQAKQDLYRKMTDVGVTREQALDVLARFSPAQVGRQVDWLPHRNAKNPARFLLAAIESHYDPPVMWRHTKAEPTARSVELPPYVPGLVSDLPGIAEDVFGQEEHAAENGGHMPLHDAVGSPDPPDEPPLPEGTLYHS